MRAFTVALSLAVAWHAVTGVEAAETDADASIGDALEEAAAPSAPASTGSGSREATGALLEDGGIPSVKTDVRGEMLVNDALEAAAAGIKSEPTSAPLPAGRVLFASLSSPRDPLPVDKMLPHQLRQSWGQPFAWKMMFVDDEGPTHLVAEHDRRVARLQLGPSAVNEVVRTGSLRPDLLFSRLFPAERKGEPQRALEMVRHGVLHGRNLAQLAFLAACADGFDYCAWLDGNVFVHRAPGQGGWVDEAISLMQQRPDLVLVSPPAPGANTLPFGGRHYALSSRALAPFLPLRALRAPAAGASEPPKRFEEALAAHFLPPAVGEGAVPPSGASWVAAAPSDGALRSLLQGSCESEADSLAALVATVEQGVPSLSGDVMMTARRTMSAGPWARLIRRRCHAPGPGQ